MDPIPSVSGPAARRERGLLRMAASAAPLPAIRTEARVNDTRERVELSARAARLGTQAGSLAATRAEAPLTPSSAEQTALVLRAEVQSDAERARRAQARLARPIVQVLLGA